MFGFLRNVYLYCMSAIFPLLKNYYKTEKVKCNDDHTIMKDKNVHEHEEEEQEEEEFFDLDYFYFANIYRW